MGDMGDMGNDIGHMGNYMDDISPSTIYCDIVNFRNTESMVIPQLTVHCASLMSGQPSTDFLYKKTLEFTPF